MKLSHLVLSLGFSFGLMLPVSAMAQPVPPHCQTGNGHVKCDKPECKKFCNNRDHHVKNAPVPHHAGKSGPDHARPHHGKPAPAPHHADKPAPAPHHAGKPVPAPHHADKPAPHHLEAMTKSAKKDCNRCDDLMRHCKGPKSICENQMNYCKRVCR